MGLFDRIRGDEGPRVAFFGIDGVPYSLISEHFDEFENLAAIAEEGSSGPIDSIVPPESSACWPALTTGVNPGETGVYGFQDREVGSYDTYVPMGRDVQATRLWDRVADDGRDATVLNVPVTFPPQRNVQRMVSGFLSPGVDDAAYPDELGDYLEDNDYRIDVNAKLGHSEDKEEFIEDAHRTLDKRFEAFKHYIEEDDWDLFFGVFMTTDRVNHFLFKHYEEDGEYKEEFIDFYRKVDDYLGQLRDLLADNVTTVIASDHARREASSSRAPAARSAGTSDDSDSDARLFLERVMSGRRPRPSVRRRLSAAKPCPTDHRAGREKRPSSGDIVSHRTVATRLNPSGVSSPYRPIRPSSGRL